MSSGSLGDSPALVQYRGLLARIEALFAEITARHSEKMLCRMGCHSCCKPNLTVGPLEAKAIRLGLDGQTERIEALRMTAAANPHKGKRCDFLGVDGACGIYELRPLVCRSHGVPLQFKDLQSTKEDAMRFRDVCGLNFKGVDIGTLPAADVMNLDTLNTLLALLTRMEFGKDDTRTALTPSALLGD